MNEAEFKRHYEATLLAIEEAIERSGADIEFETTNDILTLEFPNRSKIIINKQEPLHQIWVATRKNGYHFEYRDGQWIDIREGHELMALLTEACSSQAGEPVELG